MSNFTKISKFFEKEYKLNQHGLEELYSLFKLTKYKKGSILLQSEFKEKQLRFLNKGVVREFYFNGYKEININFYTKPQFISDLLPFSQNLTTNKNQESLSEIEILSIDREPFFKLLAKYQCGQSIVASSFQKLLKQKELLEYNRITKTPDELYKQIITNKAEWLQLIPQYHIASYLNINPETLSRIRKRIS